MQIILVNILVPSPTTKKRSEIVDTYNRSASSDPEYHGNEAKRKKKYFFFYGKEEGIKRIPEDKGQKKKIKVSRSIHLARFCHLWFGQVHSMKQKGDDA